MATINPNLYPVGSDEWLQAKLALIEPQLRKSLEEMASARGISGSGIVERQLQNELDKYKQQYMAEASDKQFSAEEAQKDREAQEKMAKEQAKASERAALWSGLGQIGGMAMLNPGVTKGMWSGIKSGYNYFDPNKTSTLGTSDIINYEPGYNKLSLSPFDSKPKFDYNKLSSQIEGKRDFGSSYGLSGLSGLTGYLLNPNKNAGTALTGAISSGIAGRNLAQGGSSWSSLMPLLATSLMPTKGNILSTKGNFFKSNLFKTLLGAGSGLLGGIL